MNTIRRTRRRARSLTSRHSLFVVSLSSFSRARPTKKRFLRVSRRHEKERSSDQPIDRSLRQDRSRKIKIPAPAWLRGFFSKRKNPLRHRLIRTGIWRGVNRSASRYGENGESFSSHAPAFSPPIRHADAASRAKISPAAVRISRTAALASTVEVWVASAGRATPLGARRGGDRAKATGARAETSGPCPSTGAARDSAGGACGGAKRTPNNRFRSASTVASTFRTHRATRSETSARVACDRAGQPAFSRRDVRDRSQAMTARAVAAPAPVEPAAGPADADAKTNNASTVAALTDPSSEQKLHVLLVEDDHATLVFVKALLKSCGHQGTCLSRARSRRARRPRARPAPTRSANSRGCSTCASNRRAKLFSPRWRIGLRRARRDGDGG